MTWRDYCRQRRAMKRAYGMVRLVSGTAEPAVAAGRVVDGCPVIERVWGLRRLNDVLYEFFVPVSVN